MSKTLTVKLEIADPQAAYKLMNFINNELEGRIDVEQVTIDQSPTKKTIFNIGKDRDKVKQSAQKFFQEFN